MSTLVVARLVDTKRCLRPVRNVGHRHEVDARRVRTVDREELDLPAVTTATLAWTLMMPIAAADVEANRSIAEATCLALNAHRLTPSSMTRSYRVFSPNGTSSARPAIRGVCITASCVRSP